MGKPKIPTRLDYDIDQSGWFARATQFHHAFRLLPLPQAIVPNIVLCSFAIETYLKLLKSVEGIERPYKDHDLLLLFEDLTEDSRRALERRWNVLYSYQLTLVRGLRKVVPEADWGDRTLISAVTEARKAFLAFRYADGVGADAATGFAAWAVPDILRERIRRLNPAFRSPPNLSVLLDPKPGKAKFVEAQYQHVKLTVAFTNVPDGKI